MNPGQNHNPIMQAMVFAAGMGSRLRPLTDTMPKALVKVGGEPLLKHVLLNLQHAGFTRVVINVHHFADQIIDYLSSNGHFGMDLCISDETAGLLETGGGIKRAQSFFSPSAPVLIHNVDILSNVNLRAFYQQADTVGAQLLVSPRKTARYLLFDNDMRLVGWTNVETGEVRSPNPYLDPSACQKFAFSGIHCFSPNLFPLMAEWPDRFSIVDFYLGICSKILIKGVVSPSLQLMDVGKQDTLVRAEAFLEQLGYSSQSFK